MNQGTGAILGLLLGAGGGLAYKGIKGAHDYNNYASTVNSGLDQDHQIAAPHKRFYLGDVKKQEDLLKTQYENRVKRQDEDRQLKDYNSHLPEGVAPFATGEAAGKLGASYVTHMLTEQQKAKEAADKRQQGLKDGRTFYDTLNHWGIAPMPAPGSDGLSELQQQPPDLDLGGMKALFTNDRGYAGLGMRQELLPGQIQRQKDSHTAATDNHSMVPLKRQNMQAGIGQKQASTAAIPERLNIAREGLGVRRRALANSEANGAYQRSGGSGMGRIVHDEEVAKLTPSEKRDAAKIRLGLKAKPKAGGGSSGINWGAVGKGSAFGTGPAPAAKPDHVSQGVEAFFSRNKGK